MNKLLTIIVLLITASLMAGWKWEQVSTSGSLVMPATRNFHVAYNPARNHFLVTIQNGTEGVETWMLNGRTWSFLNNDSVRYDMLDMAMFFDPILQTMVDFRSRPLYPTAKTHVLVWDYDSLSWTLREELPLSGQAIAYDSNRRVYVLPGMGYSGNYQTWEYDLSTLNTYPETVIPENYAFSYDPIIDRSILPRGPSTFDVWTWDGSVWVKIDSPSMFINQYYASVFSPYHGGVLYITSLHLILFHNNVWEYLIQDVPSSDDLRTSRLSFQTKENRVYAFKFSTHMSVFRLVNYKHMRPFGKELE